MIKARRMAREVTLVDAGLGNLASVERALVQVGAGVRVTRDPDKVATSRMVVFPGQSAFGAATKAIVDGAMGAALRMVIERGDPFLGICLGMQLLFEGSDENGSQEGLSVLRGWCRRFPEGLQEEAEPGARERDAEPAAAIVDEAEHAPGSDAPGESVAVGGGSPPSGASASIGSAPSPAATVQASAPASVASAPAAAGSPEAPSITSSSSPSASGSFSFADTPSPAHPVASTGATEGSAALDSGNEESTSTHETVPLPIVTPGANEAPLIITKTSHEDPPAPLMRRVKVPHMGWNEVEPTGDHYYFVHSFYVEAKDSDDVMWMARYGGIRFPAAVRKNNVLGCQFHPEKSQRAGLRFLRAFLLGGWG